MTIQFNTAGNVKGPEGLTGPFVEMIENELRKYSQYISRIEAHLKDEDGARSGPMDKRCVLEARIEGRQPIAVTGAGDLYQQAVEDALEKLKASLATVLGAARDHRR